MFSWLGKTATSCLSPLGRYVNVFKDDESKDDGLLWSKDLEKHSHGEFSFAVVQANSVLEDHSQVESGKHATFVGVYDGHGGAEASKYICDHLFGHLLARARENGTISEDILKWAFSETENGFLTLVRQAYTIQPLVAAIGSCCLVGVIWKRTLFIANLGDSRAVLGYYSDVSDQAFAEQLTEHHNASSEEVRDELRDSHPDDSQIVVMKQGVWRIKGIIQVSRSIGDAYLKGSEFALDPSFPRFHLREPLRRPVLRADPTIVTRNLQPNDKFIIFASDGLWDFLSNQEAVDIVHNFPREGIARKLVVSAMERAAEKTKLPYSVIKKLEQGTRRQIHDDITVVVIFIDQEETLNNNVSESDISVRGFVDTVGGGSFNFS